ncbi:NLI interacting factor-like phosphatase family protein [Histomonas meleagridis]|uniref:NLI interacting factor-like phosphatase family protein n=1 Tax=Histomonas meleagridis TaxID=135588 RepID=UPI0035596900|nr:NLI interacting factor-like phosphatase family protein [Histomonas meleagridis]KAH0797394.1 NLI interacting factor-like phosphatase family protein [Histomonas meleagridis]
MYTWGFESTIRDNISESLRTPPPVVRVRSRKRWSFSNIIHYLKLENVEFYQPPPIVEGKKTVVLDLDETLIHCCNYQSHPKVQSFKLGDFYVFKRPGLDNFLAKLRENFEIFVFTFGEKEYANPILDKICPFVDANHRLFRDSCELQSAGVKKDLSIFNRRKQDLILIDDNSSAKNYYPKNTIRIPKWFGCPSDTALIDWLPPILDKCMKAEDVRTVIKELNQKTKKNVRTGLLSS